MKTLHLAQRAFYAIAEPNPAVFKTLDSWRKPDPEQPLCFMSFAQCNGWLNDYLQRHPIPDTGMLSKASLERDQPHVAFMTIAAWRTGKSIVRCDGDLWDALQKTGLSEDLPGSLLCRLPFWGGYLELPAESVPLPLFEGDGLFADGVFITLTDPASEDWTAELLAMVVSATPSPRTGEIPMATVVLPLSDPLGPLLAEVPEGTTRAFWQAILPLLFYLCSEGADWGDRQAPQRPEPKQVRRQGPRFFAPPNPEILAVGPRVGAALRQLGGWSTSSTAASAGHTGRKVRPHIRRAHWHGFWRGPKQADAERQYSVKWVAPVVVNAQNDEALQAVVRYLK
ncbi:MULTISPECIES: hypothetical protein [unclassified Serratia (in: enterobacteria)]|uniref:hypothetical protein n=1 Tax=unclassified Serratia (in: enterobacteria) TaxID=2647522 RepID=UPI003076357C